MKLGFPAPCFLYLYQMFWGPVSYRRKPFLTLLQLTIVSTELSRNFNENPTIGRNIPAIRKCRRRRFYSCLKLQLVTYITPVSNLLLLFLRFSTIETMGKKIVIGKQILVALLFRRTFAQIFSHSTSNPLLVHSGQKFGKVGVIVFLVRVNILHSSKCF